MLVGGGGIRDALDSLAAHPDDWLFQTAIISKAQEIDKRRRREEIESLGMVIGAHVAKTVAKMLGG